MDTIDKIMSELKQKGISQKELAGHLGINQNNVTEWKAGRSSSYMKYLPSIAEFLGVSVDYLAGTERLFAGKDRELEKYLETLRNRPEIKMIFSLLEGATKEDVERAVRIIEALRDGKKD